MDDLDLPRILKEVYAAFQISDFVTALELAEKAHSLDFENQDVVCAMKCGVYWKEREPKILGEKDEVSRGDLLVREYQGFSARFVPKLGQSFEEGLFYLRQGIFGRALEQYRSRQKEALKGEPGLLVRIGKVHKYLGEFQKAQEALEECLGLSRDNADALAQLADCMEATGDTRNSRLLFREAFYVDPQGIDLESLQSELIARIAKDLVPKNLGREELAEWIPVKGELAGLFSIKRELRPVELGQLKQGIYALRNEMAEKKAQRPVLLPRLINRYFWLIDHYICVKEDRSRIEEVLLNIKVLDSSVYNEYIN